MSADSRVLLTNTEDKHDKTKVPAHHRHQDILGASQRDKAEPKAGECGARGSHDNDLSSCSLKHNCVAGCASAGRLPQRKHHMAVLHAYAMYAGSNACTIQHTPAPPAVERDCVLTLL